MIAWQNQTAGRLHNGLLWALGALCGIALTATLARIFAPEAWLLWGAILCALCAAMAARLLWGDSRQNIDHHPAQRARLKQEPSSHHAGPQVRLR